nr:MAG TPA: Isoprenylcysteine carboxyl methyltransferase (ICMT) family [Caudoviricetes sp.]
MKNNIGRNLYRIYRFIRTPEYLFYLSNIIIFN